VPQLVDVMLAGQPGVSAVYLMGGPEPAIVDCGPSTSVAALERGLAGYGTPLAEVRHVVLTHIHPDHGGAAGTLVRLHPHLQVHVHEVGAPHLLDPERLERSARRLYGEDFDRFFGPIEPVPAANVHVLGERVLDLAVVPTPGHAWHHVSLLTPEGECMTGDAVGVVLRPGGAVYPASAPPEIDSDAWIASLDRLAAAAPTRLLLPHFGFHDDVAGLIHRCRRRIAAWTELVERGASEDEWVAVAEAELTAEEGAGRAVGYGELAFPTLAMSYAGLRRYVDKRREAQPV
jgi:glyoxylase-like metal-dependent hydrolase (beta-lactamase superfamily II)